MLWSWNAPARADIKQDGINYPRLSVENLECLKDLRKSAGHYLGCAVAAAAVSLGVAFTFNHYAKNLIGVGNVATNVAAVVALGLGTGSVVINLEKARLKRRERKLKELGENNAQKLFEPLGDSQYSVSELETRLTNANALVAFHRNQGGGQPYADGFIEEATRQAEYITVGQFGQDLRADIQIERFVICLTLAQIFSDDRPEKPSALDECNQLIAQPGFVQKLASYMVSDSSCKEENQLIINSDYAIFLEEEMYNLCRAALVTLAVISKNEYMRDKMNKYHPDRRSDAMCYSSIVRCARIDNGLASRLESEMGIDIISQLARPRMLKNRGFGLSDDQVVAISEWSEQYRWYDPLAAEIDALSAPPPVMSAINPASAQRSL
jgi:hypothetical protein